MKAKQAVKKQKNRSDIPYVERKQMEQNALICWHRDEAARNAMRIALAALNDTEKMGFARLCRFAQRFQELCKAYYADEELEGPRLDRRLESMGFKVIDGKVLVYQDPESGEIVKIDAAEKKRQEE